jgi:ubiquinone/menaquinone biosynthesis C-methylase UbiE
MLLDIGCNWGRWSIAATKKGYTVVGIDPSLGAIMAARRVANQMGLTIKYVVGDARYLPFKSSLFNKVFSYSVLQHLSKDDVRKVLHGVGRVLKADGVSLIQMPNRFGIRSLQHQIKRRFRRAKDFEVRYWSIPELKNIFEKEIGCSKTSVDCFGGLGLQKSDVDYMSSKMRLIITFSEFLRKISNSIHVLKYVADSVYVSSRKTA